MATYSEVMTGIDEISAQIRAVQTRYDSAKSTIVAGSATLGNIPTKYADVIATINAYTPTGALETLAVDQKSKLQSEFTALKATIDALIATTEFSA